MDPADREAVLTATLARHPGAFIGAIGTSGMFVPLPDELAGAGLRPIEGPASALDLVVGADHKAVIDAWHRLLADGAADCVVHPIADPERQARLHLIDLTHRLGVHVGVISGMEDHAAVSLTHGDVRPRMVTVHKDRNAVITAAGAEITALLGWPAGEVVGRRALDLVHPDDHERAIASWMDLLNTAPGSARRVRLRHLHRDGHAVWFEITNHNRLGDPVRPGVVGEMLDISDEMAAQEAVRAGEQLLRRLTETLPMGILQIDAERRITYLNDRAARTVGARAGDALGERLLRTVLPADRPAVDDALARALSSGVDADLEYGYHEPHGVRRIRANLRALTGEDGAVTGAIVCLADVTEDVRLREELRHRATFDALTGCLNRAATLTALQEAVAAPDAHAGTAVVFVDLNGFKQTNDRYGHAAGDLLLTHVAARLRLAVPAGGVVGRMGGDEFVVICREVTGPEHARRVAAGLLTALEGGGADFDGQLLTPQASVGVAWAPRGTAEADELIARADAAMYEAKKNRTGPLALVLAA
ncbi:diguanylate cyclase domain-containing protein [Actinoplanes sp. URMC 104]|uniref:diguanylate cyclase domain-containing protein n=1 Tax=Actinoplanes sp. URMC 104 TaxID=3423409 RepID=UPI003F1C070D